MHEMSPRQVLGTIEEDAKEIVLKLTAFESAWHVVRLACSRLNSDLALAKSFAAVGSHCLLHICSVADW